ncbi:MAG TPA: hypothetical protein PLZ57_12400 [Pseudobdellovibrionaceae bacterium]|nr:hypothetical protein [Pseudobdellovibrionaceae bacterium]
MMKQVAQMAVVMATAILGAGAAHADGFECQSVDGDLNLKVYNHVEASIGTRVASTMIVSDPSVSFGRKTIAAFTDAKGTLKSSGALYTAKVDLRMSESKRKGEYLVGTRLGELAKIQVAVDFSYAAPVEDGAELAGRAQFVKRNGDLIERGLTCTRYLKN